MKKKQEFQPQRTQRRTEERREEVINDELKSRRNHRFHSAARAATKGPA
jgi:hypothetical protein